MRTKTSRVGGAEILIMIYLFLFVFTLEIARKWSLGLHPWLQYERPFRIVRGVRTLVQPGWMQWRQFEWTNRSTCHIGRTHCALIAFYKFILSRLFVYILDVI